jgi:predicted glycogen debranching enzyme
MMDSPIMIPAPGDRLLRFVGDRVQFTLRLPQGIPPGARAFLRTNLGKAARLRQEVVATHAGKDPFSVAFWRDIPLSALPEGGWGIELLLLDTGFYRAKAYWVDVDGRQHWPDGPDAGVSVHPNAFRSANTIYCAFARMFGESRSLAKTANESQEAGFRRLEESGFTVIPPSGKLRDVTRQLDHIQGTLGCRILHLLPVNPTPTTYAKMGRYGSPYACQDLITVDPALVEFDEKTTGVEQFCELTRAVHHRGGYVVLDVVLNHTGWGARLQELHPEWFVREPDGRFASPGAWGVVWGDLVELNPSFVSLWEEFAEAFLVWCRRGVDGFRCDAGYKVPVPVWQYVEARVRQEFPDTLFLLEGLGGSWEATEALLTEGGMQWAYSELFQNYSGSDVARYLDYALRQSERVGVYVHYSETHDNNRLAASGRAWSLLRNRLCALTSVSGGYGFTGGVEWLATEKVDVHQCAGMFWGARENIVSELARLNHLLAEHPCFFDGAQLRRLSPTDSAVLVMTRQAAEGGDRVLVLVNTDTRNEQRAELDEAAYIQMGSPSIDLLGQASPGKAVENGRVMFHLPPAGVYCLGDSAAPSGLSGADYRRMRAQAAWGFTALGKVLLPEQIGPCDWKALARRVAADPWRFLAAAGNVCGDKARHDLAGALDEAASAYPKVVLWTPNDCRRVVLVPPEHWILMLDAAPFEVTLRFDNGSMEHARSIEVDQGHAAFFPPHEMRGDCALEFARNSESQVSLEGQLRFPGFEPQVTGTVRRPSANSLVLLTNGRGGMARLGVDLGRIQSKYDCALGANLHSELPVDRHVFAKRVRMWVNADGFITPLNMQNLVSFQIGPPAVWTFSVEAGDGRVVTLELLADMAEGWNTTFFRFSRPNLSHSAELPSRFDVSLILRVDIEDRNFHCETHRNGGAEYHFTRFCKPLDGETGFLFAPGGGRQLLAIASQGSYHHEGEWSQGVGHPVDQSRGQDGNGDAFSPGWFEMPLGKGETGMLVVSADTPPPAFGVLAQALSDRTLDNKLAMNRAGLFDPFGRALVRAVRAFVVRRGGGRTVIAGYPWFLDWGRDSLICARGMLSMGMLAEVTEMLIIFGRFEKDGTMPNTIHGDDASNRDTSDAALWYGVVVEEAAQRLKDDIYKLTVDVRGRTIASVLRDIAVGYLRGTPNGIRVDAASGLVWSPSHFTWMDTNYPACTPREGYPVEIQVLWIRLLRQLERLGVLAAVDGIDWHEMAERAEASLQRYYWLEDRGYVSDLLIARPGQPAAEAVVDDALRSNALLAVAFGMFTGERARRAVEAARRHLLVPGALRSLAPLPVHPPLEIRGGDGQVIERVEEPYRGQYQGDEDTQRKPAYHNGTAWTWTLPTFCEAMVAAWNGSPTAMAAARAYLGSVDALMMSGCLGQLPEIVDGDAPHSQRGCDAQAWSATEVLRVWLSLNAPPPK